MSRWKWTDDDAYDSLDLEWEELEEEAHREEEKHRSRIKKDFYLDLFPEEENNGTKH